MSSGVRVNAVRTNERLWSLTRRRRSGRCSARRCWLANSVVLLAIEVIDNAADVRAGFAIWRHAVILLDPQRSGIVRSQCLGNIVVIQSEKVQKISRASLDVGLRIEAVFHAELRSRVRHELRSEERRGRG